MRIFWILFLFFEFFRIIYTDAQVCHGVKVIVTENGKCIDNFLELAFEDEFEANSLDVTKWFFVQPWGNHSERGFNASLEYQTDGLNYEFGDGKLRLAVKNEKIYAKAVQSLDSNYLLEDGLPNFRGWDYTAGMIFSKQDFGYGKYEMRCKIPKGKSFWSVFWLFGNDNDEIDVFEFWNSENVFGKYSEKKLCTEGHMTTHANGKMCPSHYTDEDFSKDFHIYSMVWNNNKIEWYVDGKLKRVSYKFYTLLGQPLDCDQIKADNFYILDKTYPLHPNLHIGVSIGIQPGKNAPDASTPFPSYLEIDYVRFYKFK